MQFRKEIIHSVTSLERWHLSGRIVEAYPFAQALLKQGGYGHHDVGFWVERPKRRGFSVIVITLSGRGDKDCAAIARYRGEDIHE